MYFIAIFQRPPFNRRPLLLNSLHESLAVFVFHVDCLKNDGANKSIAAVYKES